MMRTCLLTILVMGFSLLHAQQDSLFYVFLSEKPLSAPEAGYLDEKAVNRRLKHGQSLWDWYDMPLNPAWVEEIAATGAQVRYELRWMNAISVKAGPASFMKITDLPFVKEIIPFRGHLELAETEGNSVEEKDTLLKLQRQQLGLDALKEQGLSGKGIRIAVFDVGFRGTNKHQAFEHLRENGQILKVKDFYGGRDHVYYHNGHGTTVLSCIAGKYEDGTWLGAAPDAEFILARTENNLWEKTVEEDHWMAAMEWAEREGADIINSSLGYAEHRYEYEQMTGQYATVTRAALIAARKGMLVVNAMGNEGDVKWHYLVAPADADSILSIGGTMPMVKVRIPFSSFGPAYGNRMKPEICAPGYITGAAPNGKYKVFAGTSFATPLISGFAACVMQLFPDKTNMEIRDIMMRLGHLYPYFDYAHGHGVPDANMLFTEELPDSAGPTFLVGLNPDTVFILINQRVLKEDSLLHPNGKPFYYHIQAPDGHLKTYDYELVPLNAKIIAIPLSEERRKGIFRGWFEGYLTERDW